MINTKVETRTYTTIYNYDDISESLYAEVKKNFPCSYMDEEYDPRFDFVEVYEIIARLEGPEKPIIFNIMINKSVILAKFKGSELIFEARDIEGMTVQEIHDAIMAEYRRSRNR